MDLLKDERTVIAIAVATAAVIVGGLYLYSISGKPLRKGEICDKDKYLALKYQMFHMLSAGVHSIRLRLAAKVSLMCSKKRKWTHCYIIQSLLRRILFIRVGWSPDQYSNSSSLRSLRPLSRYANKGISAQGEKHAKFVLII